MSQKRIPLLHEVIPIIDILTEKLEAAVEDDKIQLVIKAGAERGLAILHKYYSKTDESIMYRIAMSTCFHFQVIFIIFDIYSFDLEYLILDTSLHTSSKRTGLKTGLRPQSKLFEMNGRRTISPQTKCERLNSK